MATTILPNAEATIALGQNFAAKVQAGDVLGLCGDLGAGKTQFVKGLARGLEIPGDVTSPTFTLIHEYTGGRLPLYHFDFYRLNDEHELLKIGFDDYFSEGAVLAIEWADKFPALLPRQTRWLHFRLREDGTREVTIQEAT